MNSFDCDAYIEELSRRGLTDRQKSIIAAESATVGDHGRDTQNLVEQTRVGNPVGSVPDMYLLHDFSVLQSLNQPNLSYSHAMKSVDELLDRDRQREKDGFPRKIRVGRMIKPGRGGKDKIVVVPTTVEEKFVHDRIHQQQEGDESESGGAGDGDEGEIIGEQPVREEGGSGAAGPGQGESGSHEIESNAYDLGKILTEKFELPNLKDKGKKRSLTRFTYDLTDRNRGFGQILDKKATLRSVLETNIHLGNVPDFNDIDPTKLLLGPKDKIYRILSREKDYESQAMVFFLRDYSGSMSGKPTELVVSQHVMIYSWLLFQYERQVESRFILHDTEAHEVPDFHTYYNSKVAGGTRVASAYHLVNEIVVNESLERDYNIYIFHGTDGDDWDTGGKEAVPELQKMVRYSNRIGITVARHLSGSESSEVERYINQSGILSEHGGLIRMDVLPEDADEPRLIQGLRTLIS